MCFAVLLTKTGRVYHIFTNPTSKKKVAKHHGMSSYRNKLIVITVTIINIFLQIPKDWVLLTIIVAVVTVDLLIILIGTAISSWRLSATRVRDAEHPTATDVYKLYYLYNSN